MADMLGLHSEMNTTFHGSHGLIESILFNANQLQLSHSLLLSVEFQEMGYSYEKTVRKPYVVLPPANPDNVAASFVPLASMEKPLAERVEEVVSTIRRICRQHPTNITSSLSDVRTLQYNFQGMQESLEYASSLWHDDYNNLTRQFLLQISITGGILLLVLLLVAFFCFVQSATSLGSRTVGMLEAFMVIPQPVAAAMRSRAGIMLEKVLAEADAAEHAAERLDSIEMDDDGGDMEEEAERRLIIAEVPDGDTDTDSDINSSRGQTSPSKPSQARVGLEQALRQASRRQMKDNSSRVAIVSIGGSERQVASKNTDH